VVCATPAYLKAHGTPRTPADLAGHACLVLSAGAALHADWRQRARLMRAIEMLAAGTPVTTIALSLGYDNVSAFIAMFRRVHGVTPARFIAARASD